MNPFIKFDGLGRQNAWSIRGLDPTPEEEWLRILNFLNISTNERHAMLTTVEALFRRGHELVVGTYNYLLQNPETAAILGWESGADETHLAERRRFFTLWLARVLGQDMSNDLAHYLFHAGKLHAGHGPRRTHVFPVYITGAISLVNATFSRFLSEEMPGDPAIPTALAGWNKLLAAHLHLMQTGYQAALALDHGDFQVNVSFFGKMREITGKQELPLHLANGAQMQHSLHKLFNYFPSARQEVLDIEWDSNEVLDHTGTPWFKPDKVFRIKSNWRVLLNGNDVTYLNGVETAVHDGDEIHIFPPGR